MGAEGLGLGKRALKGHRVQGGGEANRLSKGGVLVKREGARGGLGR